MRVVPFNREHLNVMDIREREKNGLMQKMTPAFLDMAENSLHCYTLIEDWRLITCIGTFKMWDGVWEVWQIPSTHVHRYVREYCKTIRGLLDMTAETEGVRRYQSHCPADDLHDRWMLFLGFEQEGTLKGYMYNGEDYRIWARRY